MLLSPFACKVGIFDGTTPCCKVGTFTQHPPSCRPGVKGVGQNMYSEMYAFSPTYWPSKRFNRYPSIDLWNVSSIPHILTIETFHVVTSTTSLKRFTDTMSIIEPFRVIIVSQLLTLVVASTKSYYFLFEMTSIIVPM
jgi:hypothetical protein